ncbi:MAG: hypothetical protein ABEJ89_05335 [Haloarculaceae archaeon]
MADDDEDGGIDRRRLVRWLIVLGIGLPILVEGITFLGLMSHSVSDGGAATATPTPAPGVGVGDDLLADTAVTEHVDSARVVVRDDGWEFVLTVTVENTGDSPYELRLERATSGEGTTLDSAATTGRIAPGATGNVTAAWTFPASERPETVTVTVVRDGDEHTETVQLAPVSVEMG